MVTEGRELGILEMLLRNHANASAADKLGYTALHLAVRYGRPKLATLLSRNIGAPLPSPATAVEATSQIVFHLTFILLNSKEASLALGRIMVRCHPTDLLYQNILAEAYLKHRMHSEASQLFDQVLQADNMNRNVRIRGRLSHRAFCDECLRPILGVRQKCTADSCHNYDTCDDCFRRMGLCQGHVFISIPSSNTLERLWPSQPLRRLYNGNIRIRL